MNFRKEKLLYRLLMMIITIGAFAGASYAQFTVTLSGPSPSATPNPSHGHTGPAFVTVRRTASTSSRRLFFTGMMFLTKPYHFPYQ